MDSIQKFNFGGGQLYRAQIGVSWSMDEIPETKTSGVERREVQTAEESTSGREALNDTRMVPDPNFVGDGRANAKGITVLYCASDIRTALLEVRAPAGAACTVASFVEKTPLKLADMRKPTKRTLCNNFENAKSCLKDEVAFLFSKRVVGDLGQKDYLLTQHISEHIKQKGFDGIIYSSSQGRGDNYAFFDHSQFEGIDSPMYEIDSVDISFSKLPSTGIFQPTKITRL